jgi:hypothetical protein
LQSGNNDADGGGGDVYDLIFKFFVDSLSFVLIIFFFVVFCSFAGVVIWCVDV